jgi:hypothetical protein
MIDKTMIKKALFTLVTVALLTATAPVAAQATSFPDTQGRGNGEDPDYAEAIERTAAMVQDPGRTRAATTTPPSAPTSPT